MSTGIITVFEEDMGDEVLYHITALASSGDKTKIKEVTKESIVEVYAHIGEVMKSIHSVFGPQEFKVIWIDPYEEM